MPAITRSQSKSVVIKSVQVQPTQVKAKQTPNPTKKRKLNETKEETKIREQLYIKTWMADRKQIMKEYTNHPICRRIRELQNQNVNLDQMLFYFGEICGESILGQHQYRWMITEDAKDEDGTKDSTHYTKDSLRNLSTIIEILKMACPNIKATIKTKSYDWGTENEFELLWNEGEMDPIIYNKFVFPDYCCVDKRTLKY